MLRIQNAAHCEIFKIDSSPFFMQPLQKISLYHPKKNATFSAEGPLDDDSRLASASLPATRTFSVRPFFQPEVGYITKPCRLGECARWARARQLHYTHGRGDGACRNPQPTADAGTQARPRRDAALLHIPFGKTHLYALTTQLRTEAGLLHRTTIMPEDYLRLVLKRGKLAAFLLILMRQRAQVRPSQPIDCCASYPCLLSVAPPNA